VTANTEFVHASAQVDSRPVNARTELAQARSSFREGNYVEAASFAIRSQRLAQTWRSEDRNNVAHAAFNLIEAAHSSVTDPNDLDIIKRRLYESWQIGWTFEAKSMDEADMEGDAPICDGHEQNMSIDCSPS